jgi:hypothetical protein
MKDPCHEITCPCCSAIISVDAATGAILSHEAPKKAHLSLEEAADEVSKEKRRTADRFSRALDERSKQSEILEKKLQKAFEKAADDDTAPPSPFDLD